MSTAAPDITTTPGFLKQTLRTYCKPRLARSIVELLVTAIPLAFTWFLMWLTVSAGYWPAALILAIPAAGFLVRLFMIQHDCSHRAFFQSKRANDWTGRMIGVLTLTPHDFWRHAHNLHHANSGNLDRPRIGGLDTLTVNEFLALPKWQQWRYRLYRHPLVLFGFGPMFIFLFNYRLPFGFLRDGWMPWISTMGTNAGIAALAGGLIWLIGLGPFLLIQLPITLLASTMGVWLFYVQHQFETTYWEHKDQWNAQDAALHGSSYYVLPGILRWFSANIGMHHVHHLASRIPCYRLPEVLRDYPELQNFSRLTLRESLGSVHLALWDEGKRRLVSFREAKAG
ncbi:fatty acid desaturase [Salicola sp. Rm-C-2C1-2]|uniref:fatty acid desaturase n=1 Tax=Salicola sp. Rm-C-2C1-2 TaxID=3141321 RepID=UPI0032E461FC